MIPMPPTTSEIEAIPPSSSVSVPLIDEAASSSWVWSKMVKSASSSAASSCRWRRSAVIAAFVAVMSAVGATLTPIVRTLSPPTKYFCTVADRDEDLVVGILEADAALGLQDADDGERDAADRDLRAEVVGIEPEGLGGRGAEDGDPQAAVDAGVGQERALPDLVGADGRRSRRWSRRWSCRSTRRRRVTVRLVETSGATPATDVELGDGLRVLEGQARRAVGVLVVGLIGQEVRPEAVERGGDVRGRALADADEGDDRGDADDDARASSAPRAAGSSAGATGRGGAAPIALMPAIRPSSRWTWRSAHGRDVRVVGDEHDRPAGRVELAEQGDDLGAGVAVEVAGRLVGEDQRRLRHERAGDGDALLLAAGQLRRLVVDAVAEAQPLEGGAGAPGRARAGRRPGRAAASRRCRARSSAAAGCTTGR